MHPILSTQQQSFEHSSPDMNKKNHSPHWLKRSLTFTAQALLLALLMCSGLHAQNTATTSSGSTISNVSNAVASAVANASTSTFKAYPLEANQAVIYGPKDGKIVSTGGGTAIFANSGTFVVPADIQRDGSGPRAFRRQPRKYRGMIAVDHRPVPQRGADHQSVQSNCGPCAATHCAGFQV